MDSTVFRPLHTASCTVRCSNCNMREICLPVGLTRDELEHIDNRLVASRRKVARGEALFRSATGSTRCSRSGPASSRPSSRRTRVASR